MRGTIYRVHRLTEVGKGGDQQHPQVPRDSADNGQPQARTVRPGECQELVDTRSDPVAFLDDGFGLLLLFA